MIEQVGEKQARVLISWVIMDWVVDRLRKRRGNKRRDFKIWNTFMKDFCDELDSIKY